MELRASDRSQLRHDSTSSLGLFDCLTYRLMEGGGITAGFQVSAGL